MKKRIIYKIPVTTKKQSRWYLTRIKNLKEENKRLLGCASYWQNLAESYSNRYAAAKLALDQEHKNFLTKEAVLKKEIEVIREVLGGKNV